MVAYAEEEPAFGIATVIIESSISFGDEDCISCTSAGQEAEQEQETNDDDDDNESSSTDNAAVERGKLLKAFSVSFYNEHLFLISSRKESMRKMEVLRG